LRSKSYSQVRYCKTHSEVELLTSGIRVGSGRLRLCRIPGWGRRGAFITVQCHHCTFYYKLLPSASFDVQSYPFRPLCRVLLYILSNLNKVMQTKAIQGAMFLCHILNGAFLE
jgi:hypothetical protein